MIGHNNPPVVTINRTGSQRKGFQWEAAIITKGETMIVCPMIGEPYRAEKRRSFFGSTRLRVERAANDYLNN